MPSFMPSQLGAAEIRRRSHFRTTTPLALALVIALSTVSAPHAFATPRNWNVAGDGNWSVAGNWSPSGVPGAGDNAQMRDTDGLSRTIAYDYAGGAVTLASLEIGLYGGTLADTETLSIAGHNLTAGYEIIGSNAFGASSGTINQSGGTNTINSTALYVGLFTSVGNYNLSGNGSLTVTGSLGEAIGYGGTGYFTQNGGSNSITASGSGLYTGYSSNGSGSYTLNSGSLSMGPVGVIANEFVGYGIGSNGTFIQNGGTNTVVNAGSGLYIAYGSTSVGSYTLTAGTLTTGPEYVGYAGSGSFTQTGGTNSIGSNGSLSVGQNAGSTGTYSLTGGTLTAAAIEIIGTHGNGTFSQSGGLNTTSAGIALYLGYFGDAGAVGSYYLSGTGALSPGGSEYVGFAGPGNFYQSGGTNTLGGTLFIANSTNITGTYTLSENGVLAANANTEVVGASGTGIFNQTGGVNTLTGAATIVLGQLANSSGAYNLSGGITTVAGNFVVGSASNATGVLTVSGGTLNVGGTLSVNSQSGSGINLSGGTISAAALNFNGRPAALTWTGGTLNITSNLALDSLAAATSTSGALGQSLTLASGQTLMVTGNENIGGAGLYVLTLAAGSAHVVTGNLTLPLTGVIEQQNGSSLYAATFTQAGGVVNGALQNQGAFVYQSGVFNGRLLNQGSVSLGLNFTAGNGVENDATITLAPGQTLTANGAGFDNVGTLQLTGGALSGNGPVVNDIGGVIQGRGTVNPAVSNLGVVTLGGLVTFNGGIVNDGLIQGSGALAGTLTNNPAGTVDVAAGNLLAVNAGWSNAGLVALEGGSARLSGGAITNTGAIQGLGLVSSAISNSGIVEARGGTLTLGGTVQNNADGLFTAGAGSKLLVTAGLATNAGIINLTGGTFDNNNHPLVNTGEISGWGIFRTGGTGLDNNGSITLSGGTTTVNGPVTNEAGQTITVAHNPAIFTGLVTNNGMATFTVTDATATFAGGFTNNGSSNFVKVGGGTLQISTPPTLKNASLLSIGDSGALKFAPVSGAASIGAGVKATVSNAATLELGGSVSALSSGANRVDIMNNSSAAAGLLVSGTGQHVGGIDGTGNTRLNSGSTLTVNHIVQGALIIDSNATLTIAASDAVGNPLVTPDSAASYLNSTGSGQTGEPFGQVATNSASFLPPSAAFFNDSPNSAILNSEGSNLAGPVAVPEPSTSWLALLALSAAGFAGFRSSLRRNRH